MPVTVPQSDAEAASPFWVRFPEMLLCKNHFLLVKRSYILEFPSLETRHKSSVLQEPKLQADLPATHLPLLTFRASPISAWHLWS